MTCPHCGCEFDPPGQRTSRANRYLWGVVYALIARFLSWRVLGAILAVRGDLDLGEQARFYPCDEALERWRLAADGRSARVVYEHPTADDY